MVPGAVGTFGRCEPSESSLHNLGMIGMAGIIGMTGTGHCITNSPFGLCKHWQPPVRLHPILLRFLCRTKPRHSFKLTANDCGWNQPSSVTPILVITV